jgi:hypothetical protein
MTFPAIKPCFFMTRLEANTSRDAAVLSLDEIPTKYSLFKQTVVAVFVLSSLLFSQAASADPYAIACYATGSLGSSRYVIHVNDPLIPNITSPRVTMSEPPYGVMDVLYMNDVRLAVSVEHGAPGFPRAILTLIVNRDNGVANFFLTKTPLHDPISGFWIISDDILGKDQGGCEKFAPKL